MVRAISAVSTCGQMTPYAPASSRRMISTAVDPAGRASGTASVVEIACSIATASEKSIIPCCKSTVTASKPQLATSSAPNDEGMDSHAFVAVLPALSNSFGLFFLILHLHPSDQRNRNPFRAHIDFNWP